MIKEKDVIKSAVIINKDIKGKNEMSNSKEENFGKNILLIINEININILNIYLIKGKAFINEGVLEDV